MRCCLTALVCGLIALAPLACGGEDDETVNTGANAVIEDPGPIHVHGLGVNPADGALFVATHTGLFRAPRGEQRAERVSPTRIQDTMGFTVTGPEQFLGSGHPDGREDLPPFLGLIRSTDAGRTWEPASFLGERDFHILEAAGSRIYGYGSDFESQQASLLVSGDGGRSWENIGSVGGRPAALDNAGTELLVALHDGTVKRSVDDGRSWTLRSRP